MRPLDAIVRAQRARYLAAHGKLATGQTSARSWAIDQYRRRNNIPPDQELTEEQIDWALECERMNWE